MAATYDLPLLKPTTCTHIQLKDTYDHLLSTPDDQWPPLKVTPNIDWDEKRYKDEIRECLFCCYQAMLRSAIKGSIDYTPETARHLEHYLEQEKTWTRNIHGPYQLDFEYRRLIIKPIVHPSASEDGMRAYRRSVKALLCLPHIGELFNMKSGRLAGSPGLEVIRRAERLERSAPPSECLFRTILDAEQGIFEVDEAYDALLAAKIAGEKKKGDVEMLVGDEDIDDEAAKWLHSFD